MGITRRVRKLPGMSIIPNYKRSIDYYIKLQAQDIIIGIVKKYNIGAVEATKVLYGSKTYKLLQDKQTKLWTESPYYVMEMIEEEMQESHSIGVRHGSIQTY